MMKPNLPPVCFEHNLQLTPCAMDRLKRQQKFRDENAARFAKLSPRELEILVHICRGETNEEIAKELFLAKNTIRTHRNNIWRRLEIRSVVEAVWWGQCFDLV